MNISSYDNVPVDNHIDLESFSQEAVACVVNDVFELLKCPNYSSVYFCPFCVLSFPDSHILKKHLSSQHLAFLWDLTTRSVNFDVCPFCPGKFVGYRLVAKHSLHYHLNVLIEAYFPKNNGLVKCIFCQTLCEAKLMTFHLDNHALEFDDWFKDFFPMKSGGVAGLVEVKHNEAESVMHVDCLQDQLENLRVVTSPKVKSILKSPHPKPGRLPVRRVLTFMDNKENIKTHSEKVGKSPKIKRNENVNLSWDSASNFNKYQCGKCGLSFPSRLKLVTHIKTDSRKHRTLLQPLYQCALCNAKFYKSSYLEKHCVTHSSKPRRLLR